jgi:predicted Zn-dependent protease
MHFSARYSDGHSASIVQVAVEAQENGLEISTQSGIVRWNWKDVRRADDGVGRVVFRHRKDDGARLTPETEGLEAIRAFAPALLGAQAIKRPGVGAAMGLLGIAAALLVVFAVGLPLLAQPIARMAPISYEQRIGEIAWSQVQSISGPCNNNAAGRAAVQALVDRLGRTAGVNRPIEAHVVAAGFPNAFALPGGRVVVTDDLIAMADRPDELAGVLAHEIAHIERRHVLANVIRQMGLGLMADIVLGGGGLGQMLAALSLNAASLHYSRADETEADVKGLVYLRNAGLDPGGLAKFFDKIGKLEKGAVKFPQLMSTHPNSKARAENARRAALPGRPPALNAAEWDAVKSMCPVSPADKDGAGK